MKKKISESQRFREDREEALHEAKLFNFDTTEGRRKNLEDFKKQYGDSGGKALFVANLLEFCPSFPLALLKVWEGGPEEWELWEYYNNWARSLNPEFKTLADFAEKLSSIFTDDELTSLPIKFLYDLDLTEVKSFDELIELIKKGLYPPPGPTFAMPSHPLMFTLLAMFSGKPQRIPRKLLTMEASQRTLKEQQEAQKFLDSIIEKKERIIGHDEKLKPKKEERIIALVSDNPRVEAQAEITGSLFKDVLSFREESLAIYIKRTFGPEGLKHLLGLIIGLEENFRQGFFEWDINEHLERLGYKKKKGGAFKPELKKTASEIVKIFSSFFITAKAKRGKRSRVQGKKLFSIDGFDIEQFEDDVIKESLTIRATDFWYRTAFKHKDDQSQQYTKLLKKIARENLKEHPLTIYLAPLLAVMWRLNPEKTLSIENLMDWCNLDAIGHHRMYNLRDLESELNYMKQAEYLGHWKNTASDLLPSQCKNPFDCILELYPPSWLKKELKAIEDKKEKIQLLEPAKKIMTNEEFINILNNSGLSMKQIANHLGVSASMISQIKSGKKRGR